MHQCIHITTYTAFSCMGPSGGSLNLEQAGSGLAVVCVTPHRIPPGHSNGNGFCAAARHNPASGNIVACTTCSAAPSHDLRTIPGT